MQVLTRRPYLRLGLAATWMMLTDSYTLSSLAAGFLMATLVFAALAAPQVRLRAIRLGGPVGALRWLVSAGRLTLYFLWELLKANHQVAKLVLKPNLRLEPGVIIMTLRTRRPGHIALLTALITLTPGTLVLEVEEEQDRLFIHSIDAANEEEALRAPRRFEEMIMEVMP